MAKVGILTLSASDNCGSLLQAYALQEILKHRFDCYVEIINLVTEQSNNIYGIFPKKFYAHPKKTFFTIKYLNSIKTQKKGYQEFRDKFLNMTPDVYRTVEDISKIVNGYDILITGSDQVWNVYMSDFCDAFYLPWQTNARKIAYATSLGSAFYIDNEKARQLSGWLKDFDKISVRERTGKNTIQKITDKDISITADPTLLLSYAEWNSIVDKPLVKKPYVFYYSWAYLNEDMNKIVQEFAQKNRMDVFVINSSRWYKFRPNKFGFKLFKESGPEVFLNLMKYADYVFVQSFHGVIFSNIFHKRFFFLNENDDGQIDFRSQNLIECLHEEKQVVHSYEDIRDALTTNLTFTSGQMEKLVEDSLAFLSEAVRDGNE